MTEFELKEHRARLAIEASNYIVKTPAIAAAVIRAMAQADLEALAVELDRLGEGLEWEAGRPNSVQSTIIKLASLDRQRTLVASELRDRFEEQERTRLKAAEELRSLVEAEDRARSIANFELDKKTYKAAMVAVGLTVAGLLVAIAQWWSSK